jgi:hypothetical protein
VLDADVGDLRMVAAPRDDPETTGEMVDEVTGRDLDAHFVQPRLGLEALEEEVEAFLPGGFAEVVGAGTLDGLGHEAVSIESLVAHRTLPIGALETFTREVDARNLISPR